MALPTKQMYLVNGLPGETYAAFTGRISAALEGLIADSRITRLSYTITKDPPPVFHIIPFRKKMISCISVWKQDAEAVSSLSGLQGLSGAYAVTEALPVSYEKDWPDGQQTPGVCLLTLFQQKKGIDRSTFLDRWHNSHTPMSLKVHPLWHYDRNVVDNKLNAEAYGWDGIVQEHMRTRKELMNPFKFFGHPGVIIQRMIAVYRDTKSFLNYKTVEPYLVAEYHLKSQGTPAD